MKVEKSTMEILGLNVDIDVLTLTLSYTYTNNSVYQSEIASHKRYVQKTQTRSCFLV